MRDDGLEWGWCIKIIHKSSQLKEDIDPDGIEYFYIVVAHAIDEEGRLHTEPLSDKEFNTELEARKFANSTSLPLWWGGRL
jgi:hypothetical protein